MARDRRRFNRAVREYRENAPQQLMRPEERLAITAQQSRADEQDGEPDPPPPIKPVPTPLDDQAGAVERAELRQAAGAETGEAAPAQRPRVNFSDALNRMDTKGGRDRAERPRLRLSDALDQRHKA